MTQNGICFLVYQRPKLAFRQKRATRTSSAPYDPALRGYTDIGSPLRLTLYGIGSLQSSRAFPIRAENHQVILLTICYNKLYMATQTDEAKIREQERGEHKEARRPVAAVF